MLAAVIPIARPTAARVDGEEGDCGGCGGGIGTLIGSSIGGGGGGRRGGGGREEGKKVWMFC